MVYPRLVVVTDSEAVYQHAYIRRRGRITTAQQRGYELAQAAYKLTSDDLSEAQSIGQRVGLEIGFGMGHALVHWAQQEPERLIIGVELYQPGVGSAAHQVDAASLTNVRIIEQPAQTLLDQLPAALLDEVRIYFPDPWPKKRHFKRRLIQPEFLAQLARVLVDQGVVKLATDWSPYADWIRECFANHEGFALRRDVSREHTQPHSNDEGTQARPTTKFERRGERLGHVIHDLEYQINSATTESR